MPRPAPITAGHEAEAAVWKALERVMDPEIPVLSVVDLGIVRALRIVNDELSIDIAPTYSGCPAMEVIEHSIAAAVRDHGYRAVHVERVLSPPWTTDWISDEGRRKLSEYGIAPPTEPTGKAGLFHPPAPLICPRCASTRTQRVSEFGSTLCKAAWRCDACLEPFEHFKCI